MCKLDDYINEYKKIIESVWGTYLDSTTGFRNVKQTLEYHQESTGLDIDYLDNRNFYYGSGDPNNPNSIVLHECKQGEIKLRNNLDGENYKFIGNMSLISIYQYWEDYYRNKIAQEKGINKGDLNSDIMGDIRYLRNSIVHHKGIALKDIEKCKILKWYRENDEIFINQDKLEIIRSYILEMLREL